MSYWISAWRRLASPSLTARVRIDEEWQVSYGELMKHRARQVLVGAVVDGSLGWAPWMCSSMGPTLTRAPQMCVPGGAVMLRLRGVCFTACAHPDPGGRGSAERISSAWFRSTHERRQQPQDGRKLLTARRVSVPASRLGTTAGLGRLGAGLLVDA